MVIELLVLATHFFPDVFQQVCQLFTSLTQRDARVVDVLIPQRLQLSDATLQELDLFYAAQLALTPQVAHLGLDALEKTNGPEHRPLLLDHTLLWILNQQVQHSS